MMPSKLAVSEAIAKGKLWKEPLIQFNPAFDTSESRLDLIKADVIHDDLKNVFKGYPLYAIRLKRLGWVLLEKILL